ncbi:unnamed protein product [Rodentolepis nana]|uniref:Uncharacterized protein n=1 Tax=Rodentolepis nana TaxID=102285 RepID=A0A3P7VAR8_RODNA|nr:unnamed protein product [Rodentolepis nana]
MMPIYLIGGFVLLILGDVSHLNLPRLKALSARLLIPSMVLLVIRRWLGAEVE